VLNFRYFGYFFFTPDSSGGIAVDNELNFSDSDPTIPLKNRVKNKPRNVFIFNSPGLSCFERLYNQSIVAEGKNDLAVISNILRGKGSLQLGNKKMPKKIFIAKELTKAVEIGDGRKLYFTAYSEMRIQSREIPIDYIIKTFNHPDIIMPHVEYENARNYVKHFNGNKVKIGVKDQDEPFVLITAFFQQTYF